MDLKAVRKNVLMVLIGVGLPLIILYNIFRADAPTTPEIEGLPEIEKQLAALDKEDYRLHSVQNDGGILRVNIVLSSAPTDTEEARMRTLSALYDVQSVVGKDRTVSVWAGTTTTGQQKLKLHGVAYFSSITDNYNFKSADEIK